MRETLEERMRRGLWWERAWTLVEGCSPVSPGCDRCWSADQSRLRAGQAGAAIRARYAGLVGEDGRFRGEIRLMRNALGIPERTRRPALWSVWNDLFHPLVPEEFVLEAYVAMGAAAAYGHRFMVLTKRPGRAAEILPRVSEELKARGCAPLGPAWSPVWLGTTVEEAGFLPRVEALLKAPAGGRFLSAEPILGPLEHPIAGVASLGPLLADRCPWCGPYEPGGELLPQRRCASCGASTARIGLVIVGGETGRGARPCRAEWVRGIRDACRRAGRTFFFKGWGESVPGRSEDGEPLDLQNGETWPVPEEERPETDPRISVWDVRRVESPDGDSWLLDASVRVGRRRAGRRIDGQEWTVLPKALIPPRRVEE